MPFYSGLARRLAIPHARERPAVKGKKPSVQASFRDLYIVNSSALANLAGAAARPGCSGHASGNFRSGAARLRGTGVSHLRGVSRLTLMPVQRRIIATLICFGAVVCLVAVVRFAGGRGSDAIAAAAGAEGTTYYVSPSGDDRYSGRSPERAWRTISRVDRADLHPGDRVLFEGGKVFSGRELEPPASGTAYAPIRFASYGGGRAELRGGTDVWLPAGRHDLVFANLDFSGSQILFASSAEGSGTYRITIRNASFHDTPQGAINVSNRADRDWTITRTSLRHIGDSGIFVWGSDITISNSTITDTGWNPAVTWGAHGIYDKGRRTVIVHDTITGFQADGVSLRSDSARVAHNTIRGGPVGIAYFDFDTRSGTTQVVDNRITGVKTAFYFSGDADAITGRAADRELLDHRQHLRCARDRRRPHRRHSSARSISPKRPARPLCGRGRGERTETRWRVPGGGKHDRRRSTLLMERNDTVVLPVSGRLGAGARRSHLSGVELTRTAGAREQH